jgi:hypothetical protein
VRGTPLAIFRSFAASSMASAWPGYLAARRGGGCALAGVFSNFSGLRRALQAKREQCTREVQEVQAVCCSCVPQSKIVKINLAHSAARRFDRELGARRHTSDLNVHLVLKALVPGAQQLDALTVDLAPADVGVEQRFHGDDAVGRDATAVDECGQLLEVERREENGVRVGEAALGHAAVQRRLPTLEPRSRRTMARRLTFVAFASGLPLA